MAWINEDDARWEPDGTELTIGRALYWLTTVIAAFIVIFAVGDFFTSWAQGTPILRIVGFIDPTNQTTTAACICRALLP